MALLLHGLVALSLWQLSRDRPLPPVREEAIEVTIEKPAPEPTQPEPAPQLKPEPMPALPPIEGLRPPAPIVSEKPTQIPNQVRQNEAVPPQTTAKPEPQAAPPPPPAHAKPPEPPKPAPSTHGIVVPPANPLPRPPTHIETRPQPPQLQPSPLRPHPSQRQAATTPGPEQPAPSRFVNPADTYNRARIGDNYLWQVVSRLHGYRYYAHVTVPEGITVIQIVIARDGRLLDAQIVSSSGQPEMDRGVLAGVRAGSPYAPLPPDIQGPSATFRLPLVSSIDR
jgi:protein TonB